LLERQRSDAARLYFDRALRLAPDSARAHAGLGRAYVDQGREAEGLALLATALEIDPQLASARDELVWVLATSRDETIRDLPAAIRRAEAALDPRAPRARLLDALAAAHARSGRPEQALDAARRALRAALASDQHLYAAGLRQRVERYQRELRAAAGPS